MSTAWKEKLLALAMGTHPRLGGGSSVFALGENLLETVGEAYWGRRVDGGGGLNAEPPTHPPTPANLAKDTY
jgi:hypothetical protein